MNITKRILAGVVVFIALFSLLGFAQVAYAGEWNDPHGYIAGDAATPIHGQSACAFNGLDEPDDDPRAVDGDDGVWAQTPAGGNVQSGGQLIAAGFAPPGIQGAACNPTS